nr:uncharacterized protein LOC104115664 [Nicotiana tomentosiformis]
MSRSSGLTSVKKHLIRSRGTYQTPHVLVPPKPGRPLILYLTVLDNSFGCVLGQHDIMGKKEKAIYYLSKKFTPYEVKYTLLERTRCALTWVAQKLKYYLSSYATYLISRMDPLKYIFQKPMPTGRLAKGKILLTEFDIIYVTRTAMKAQALADHLAENPVDGEYVPLRTYFPDEEVLYVDEVDHNENRGQHYPVTVELRFYYTNNMAEYEACILGLRLAVDMRVQEILSVEFRHIPRIHNEIVNVLATLDSMLHHPDKAYVDPMHIQVRDQYAYCNMVEWELDSKPWFHDIKEYFKSGIYLVHATCDQKRTIRRLTIGVFLSGVILYKRTPDLGLLRCVDAKEASTVMTEVHSGVCGPHMNGCMVASNGHRFILVVIDYFTKWVEAVTFKSATKKKVVDFVHSNIICQFGIPKVIITDNGANLNNHLMKEACEQFKIMYWNSTPYRPKANGVVEAANKNIKKILRKMVQGSRQWHEKLHFALLGYRTTVLTSVGATPYLLVYGTEAVIPVKVEIPCLRIVAEAKIDDDEWVKTRLEQLNLIKEKRLASMCHGQLYQKRMGRAYNKKVRPRKFEVGQLVLKHILPHQAEAKGKFAPNWQGPFTVTRVLPNDALYLTDIEGKVVDTAINSDAVKRYYV